MDDNKPDKRLPSSTKSEEDPSIRSVEPPLGECPRWLLLFGLMTRSGGARETHRI
jgi:hypothetical protein